MRSVKTHPEADAELLDAVAFYSDDNPEIGVAFREQVDQAIGSIARNPDLWPVRDFGCRMLVMKRFPYLIWFRVRIDEIEVIAVAHGSRRPGYWKQRILG